MFKKRYNADAYKTFLRRIVVCEETKEMLINKINVFNEKGKISIDGNNLYGKIINKEGNDYLEIRLEKKCLVCNFTEWNGIKTISITQTDLKNGNVKINTREKTEFRCFEDENKTRVEEIERIYNSQKKLIYDSKFEQNETYDSTKSAIVYEGDNGWNNDIKLTRKWYIPNGSIICYIFNKECMIEESKLNEGYFIIPKSYCDEFTLSCSGYIDLDKNLFNLFMTGKITIEELLEQNQNIKKNKTKVK